MSVASSPPMLLSGHSLVDPPGPRSSRRRVEEPPGNPSAFREIVACLDGSDLGSGIVPHAEIVASALRARLTLLHVLEPEASDAAPADPLDWGIRQREARAYLAGVGDQVGELEAGVRSELIQGRAAEQICSWAEQHDVDLTVVCSHGFRGVTDWDLASTARKLFDRTPGSLLLVPAAAASKGGELRYQRILVPLDGSPRGERVVPLAMRVAESQGAEVLLAHVVPVPQITRTGPLDPEGAELQRLVTEHNYGVASVYLDRLRAQISQGGSRVRSTVVRDGSVRTRLERLIREEAPDLVVMSAHGHTGRTDSACGSVTEYAVTHASIPVLVVRDRRRRRTRRIDPPSAQPQDPVAPRLHAPL